MSEKGILVVVSGFSGAGKGTVMKELLKKYDNYALSVSATTRKPRKGEQEGVDYFYKSESEFEEMIQNDAFIEYAKYVQNYYGTPKEYVEKQLSSGKDVVLEIELQGALQVKRQRPETLLLFVTPPSADELERRLIGRGTETSEEIQNRMKRAVEESGYMDAYDYIVLNEKDQVDACVDTIHQIIMSQHRGAKHQSDFIMQIQKELKNREE